MKIEDLKILEVNNQYAYKGEDAHRVLSHAIITLTIIADPEEVKKIHEAAQKAMGKMQITYTPVKQT